MNVKNRKILITGGLGFVGSAIAERLLKEEVQEVRLFDMRNDLPERLQNIPGKERLRVIAGDIRDPSQIGDALKGCDYVFHQAALRVTRCAKEPRLAHEILVDGTFNVVEACVQYGIKKVIQASSAIVYGEPLRLPLDENHPAHDTTIYGISKVANENLLRSYRALQGLNYTVLRYFNIYGPGLNLFGPETEVLVRWLDRLDEGQTPLIFGDGKQTLDWIHIDDIVEANWLALQSEISGEVFNVCTGRETPLLELLEILLRVRGTSLHPEFREDRKVNQVARRFGNPEKAKRLGFKAHVTLERGLEDFVKWRDTVIRKQKMSQEVSSPR